MVRLAELRHLVEISRSEQIARRYFVTNGFDGSLAMLGLIVGFRSAEPAMPEVALAVCSGTALALGISGFVSTYVTEKAEQSQDLHELSAAMLQEMEESTHRRAMVWVPVLVATVSGLSPFLVAQLIMAPLWVSHAGLVLPFSPFDVSVGLAFIVIFCFGVLLGHVAHVGWLTAGLSTLLVGVLTAALIALVAP